LLIRTAGSSPKFRDFHHVKYWIYMNKESWTLKIKL